MTRTSFKTTLPARAILQYKRLRSAKQGFETCSNVVKRMGAFATVLIGCCILDSAWAEPEVWPPERERNSFHVADGFEVSLYASEELGVLNPMQMRWDARGRLFVISTLGYPQLRPGEKPNDKIVMLEDRDGDGQADTSTVFAEGLNIPTGLELGYGGVFVGEQTALVFLKDTDGDGKADHREVVLSGFGVGDTHQAINSFVWSPGGELFLDQGDGIESRVETPWGVSGLYQAGVMRFRPKRLQLDPFLDDFMGPGNPWGIAFDDWGQTFVVDGAGGITFLSPAMLPVHHRRRLRTIGEPGGYCGVDVIGSQHLPEDYQGDFLVCDFHRNRIGRFSTPASGAGFEVAWKDPLLVSSHRNFRPVDVRTGPDGAVYICDWYNSIICHQDDPFRHPDRDFAHGRIWRVSNPRQKVVQPPQLVGASNADLLNHLSSPERWIRYQTKRVLADRDAQQVHGDIVAFWNARKQRTDHLLLELVSVLESVERPDEELLHQLVAAGDYRARAYGARVVGRWCDRMERPLAVLKPLMHDPHPQVRMEATVACSYIPNAHSAEVAAMALDYEVDYDQEYALSQTLHHLSHYWIPAFKTGVLTFGGKTNRIAGVLERVESKDLRDALRRIGTNEDMPKEVRLAVLKTLTKIGDPDDLQLVWHAAADPRFCVALLSDLLHVKRDPTSLPDHKVAASLKQFLMSTDDDVAAAAIRLVGKWKQSAFSSQVLQIALSSNESRSKRHAAIASAGELGGAGSVETLRSLAENKDVNVRLAAVQAMSQIDVRGASQLAMHLISASDGLTDLQLQSLIRAFAKRKQGLTVFSESVSTDGLDPKVAGSLLNALNATGFYDQQLLAQLQSAIGTSSTLPEYSPDLVVEMIAAIKHGDPQRGESVFLSKQANCFACHQIGGVGGTIGPDLSAVGTTLPLDRLVQEVMWPQRLVKEGFTLSQIVTEEGRVFQGYVQKRRDKSHIHLKTLDAGETIQIDRDEIEHQAEVGSAMPANIAGTLSADDRVHLLRFLSELGKPGRYDVPSADVIRNWQQQISDDWNPAYPRISGQLDLTTLNPQNASQIVLKSEFTTGRERRRLEFDNRQGLSVWIDGQLVELDENVEMDFQPGLHELKLIVDVAARRSKELIMTLPTVDR